MTAGFASRTRVTTTLIFPCPFVSRASDLATVLARMKQHNESKTSPKTEQWQPLGRVTIDTARLLLVDPVNVDVNDRTEGECFIGRHDYATGVITATGIGDGSYLVEGRHCTHGLFQGRLAEVRVRFLDEDGNLLGWEVTEEVADQADSQESNAGDQPQVLPLAASPPGSEPVVVIDSNRGLVGLYANAPVRVVAVNWGEPASRPDEDDEDDEDDGPVEIDGDEAYVMEMFLVPEDGISRKVARALNAAGVDMPGLPATEAEGAGHE